MLIGLNTFSNNSEKKLG